MENHESCLTQTGSAGYIRTNIVEVSEGRVSISYEELTHMGG